MAYDVESLFADLEAHLKSQLNTEIAAINSEKNDTIVLDTIDAAAYILQSLDAKATNFNPFVFYGVETINTKPNGPQLLSEITFSVLIIAADKLNEASPVIRMFRYHRALRKVVAAFFKNSNSNILAHSEIVDEVPVEFKLMNSTAQYRAIGVVAKVALG
jgi:hypothetical protein